MTSWSETLLTTAQVAVAFAGFTGLIGLFVTRERGLVEGGAMLRFRTMLDYSVIALLAALFPFLPDALQLPDQLLWRVSSIAMTLGLLGYWLFVGRTLLRSADYPKTMAVSVFLAGDIATILLLIENASGFFHAPAFFTYLAVVFWQLVGAVFGFYAVVALAWDARAE